MIKIINFDMDRVLVDLSKNLARLDGYDDPVLWYIHQYEKDGKYLYSKSIERHIDDKCFETCQPMPYYTEMKSLMKYLFSKGYKINILSSCMDRDYSDEIVKQKINWLHKYYGEEMKMFNAVNIVRGSTLKINHICDQSILIDDYQRTHNTFIEKGMGDQFVLYHNYNDCISKLNELNII